MVEINRDFLQPLELFLLDNLASGPVDPRVHNEVVEELLGKLATVRCELDAAYDALAADGSVEVDEDDDALSCMTIENVRDELSTEGSIAERVMRTLLTRIVDHGHALPGPHVIVTMEEGKPELAQVLARWTVPNGLLEITSYPDGTAKVFGPNVPEDPDRAWPAVLKLLGSLAI